LDIGISEDHYEVGAIFLDNEIVFRYDEFDFEHTDFTPTELIVKSLCFQHVRELYCPDHAHCKKQYCKYYKLFYNKTNKEIDE